MALLGNILNNSRYCILYRIINYQHFARYILVIPGSAIKIFFSDTLRDNYRMWFR